MNSSEPAKIELPLVVYTNSTSDFCVTVRSPAPAIGAERLAAELARRCDPWINEEFVALVGVAPSPANADRWLAFRVFDAGIYYQRPHTVAVVVLEIPRGGDAGWRAAQLLAALPTPTPGASNYELPTGEAVRSQPVDATPHAALARWERENKGADLREIVAFGEPARANPSLAGLAQGPPREKSRLMRYTAVAAILAALTAVAFGLRHAAAPGSGTAAPALLSPSDREELLALLTRSGAPLSPELSNVQLEQTVISTGGAIERRTRALAQKLDAADTPEDTKGAVEECYKLWKQPLKPQDDGAFVITEQGLAAARRVHVRYQQVRELVDRLANQLDPAGEDYARALEQLRTLLRGSH